MKINEIKKEKPMRAIIYCRVSTKEQVEEGLSLKNQEKACIEFADKQGFIKDKIFIEEGESAKTQLRTQLIALLDYCQENKGKIDALIVWKVDRFARQTSDHFAVKAILAKYGVRLYSVTEPINDSPQGQMMEGMLAVFAQFDNDVRSERSIIGMRDRINEGRWVWRAPLGYINSKDTNGEPMLIIDKERAEIITRAFEEFSKGLYSQIALWGKLREWGLKNREGKLITKQTVNKLLTNTLYMGLIKNPWTGEYVKGLHKPLTDERIFNDCQAIMKGKKPSVAPRLRNNPDFPLRGFVKCGNCGAPLTGSKPKGRTKRYEYYHCHKCRGQKNIPKDDLEKDFLKLLEKVKPAKNNINTFKQIVMDRWVKKYKELNQTRTDKEGALEELEDQRKQLVKKYNTGKIAQEEYEVGLDDINNERIAETIVLNETRIEELNVEGILNYAENFMLNVPKLWKDADLDQRQRFQQLIFPEGLTYGKNGFIGTYVLSPVYGIFETSGGRKSTMVVPRGVEPLLPG